MAVVMVVCEYVVRLLSQPKTVNMCWGGAGGWTWWEGFGGEIGRIDVFRRNWRVGGLKGGFGVDWSGWAVDGGVSVVVSYPD